MAAPRSYRRQLSKSSYRDIRDIVREEGPLPELVCDRYAYLNRLYLRLKQYAERTYVLGDVIDVAVTYLGVSSHTMYRARAAWKAHAGGGVPKRYAAQSFNNLRTWMYETMDEERLMPDR